MEYLLNVNHFKEVFMYQNYEVLARDEAYLGMMKQVYRVAVLSLQGSSDRSSWSMGDIAAAAKCLLLERIDHFEKKGFEKWKLMYGRSESYILRSPEKLQACFQALASGLGEGAANILAAGVTESAKETEPQNMHTLGVNEVLYNAGEAFRDCILEFDPEMDEQEVQSIVFSYMRSTVMELSAMPGDGAVQSYAPVMELSPEEAVKKFKRILFQTEWQKLDETDVTAAIEQMRSLFVDSVNRWADGMKEHFAGL